MEGTDMEAHTAPMPQLQGPRAYPNGSKLGGGSTHSDVHADPAMAPPYGFPQETLGDP